MHLLTDVNTRVFADVEIEKQPPESGLLARLRIKQIVVEIGDLGTVTIPVEP